MLVDVLKNFRVLNNCQIISYGNGLINETWLIETENGKFILQHINESVFKIPDYIDKNIKSIASYLTKNHPQYKFITPLTARENVTLIKTNNGYYRLFNFVEESQSYDVVNNPQMAYEAAKQFGKFTKLLSGFDASQLKITLPDFHNLTLRYRQFLHAANYGDIKRIEHSKELIKELKSYSNIVEYYEAIKSNHQFKKRVIHHDTKISNVLFDDDDKGICVIDLDTVMPGYFISDLGDMLRTYLSPASEEETDFSKIIIRTDFLEATIEGYLCEMESELTKEEMNAIMYAGKFIIYMQALRFITDYLNNDIYYCSNYELHNFNRAVNQLTLLKEFITEPFLQKLVK